MVQATDSFPSHNFIIEAAELSKRFNREWIFRKLNYTFHSGNTYAVTGPNGSGKSTLLQILWGQTPQTSGDLNYSFNGRKVEVEEVFKHISIATPYMDLIDEFTLLEQLNFHFKLKDLKKGLSISDVAEAMYLQSSLDKVISNFSSGMKQRLKLGLAFFSESQVIFLDEPGTNLDEQAFAWYKENLRKIAQTKLIIIASNDPKEYPEDAIKVDLKNYKK